MNLNVDYEGLDPEIVVPMSGGKDSQCCFELAIKTGKRVIGMFCDTGWEHPLTYAHIDLMKVKYKRPIITLSVGTVEELVLRYKRFPHMRSRFCTSQLKIRPGKVFYTELAKKIGHGFEVWIGVRTGESSQRAKRYCGVLNEDLILPHDFMSSEYPKYLGKLGVMIRLPIIEWSTEEVMAQLNGRQNPLYSQGSDRVGCFPCLASGDAKKERDFNQDDVGREHYEIVLRLEKQIGKSIWTSKGGQDRNCNSGCTFCEI